MNHHQCISISGGSHVKSNALSNGMPVWLVPEHWSNVWTSINITLIAKFRTEHVAGSTTHIRRSMTELNKSWIPSFAGSLIPPGFIKLVERERDRTIPPPRVRCRGMNPPTPGNQIQPHLSITNNREKYSTRKAWSRVPEVTIENRKQETWAFWTKYSTRIITIQSTPVRDGFLLKLSEHVANYLLPYYPLRALGWTLTEYGDSLQGLTTTELGNKFNRGTSLRGSMLQELFVYNCYISWTEGRT